MLVFAEADFLVVAFFVLDFSMVEFLAVIFEFLFEFGEFFVSDFELLAEFGEFLVFLFEFLSFCGVCGVEFFDDFKIDFVLEF